MTSHNNKLFNYEMEIYLILKRILIKKKFVKNFEFKYNTIIKLLFKIIKNINIIDDNDEIE